MALGSSGLVICQDLVEQVVLDLLAFDKSLGELRIVLHLLVAERFQARAQRIERAGDGV